MEEIFGEKPKRSSLPIEINEKFNAYVFDRDRANEQQGSFLVSNIRIKLFATIFLASTNGVRKTAVYDSKNH